MRSIVRRLLGKSTHKGRGPRPLEFLAGIAVLESDPAPLSSQTPASEAPLTLPPSDITLTAPRAKSLGTATCRGAVDHLAFCAEPGVPPPDLRHQFGRPQALDALPPLLIRRSGMSQGIQGGHQSSTAFASPPDSDGSYRQWSKAIVAVTSTDELRSDPNPVN